MKKGSVGHPKIYLGNKVSKVTVENGLDAWAFSSSQYVQATAVNVERYLSKRGYMLPKRTYTPFMTNYRPEIHISPNLNSTDAAYYQSVIFILR